LIDQRKIVDSEDPTPLG